MAACEWHQHIPPGEQPRGTDQSTVARSVNGWRCRHQARPGSTLCTVHEETNQRRIQILDWAVYHLSRRRDSFAGHAYDWATRRDVARLAPDRLAAALDLIVEDRARDGAKRGVVELSDLVRAVGSVQRDKRRERRASDGCRDCFGSGWRVVFDDSTPGMSGAVACGCSEGGRRSSEAQERGRPVCNVQSMPDRWATVPPEVPAWIVDRARGL